MSGVKYFTFLIEVLKNNFNLPMLVRRPVKKLYIVFWNQLCQTEIRSEHRWKLRARDTKYEKNFNKIGKFNSR